jgi:hypothetical protein
MILISVNSDKYHLIGNGLNGFPVNKLNKTSSDKDPSQL